MGTHLLKGFVGAAMLGFVCASTARAQSIERISVSSAGVEANGSSSRPRLSQDGRFVAFRSEADNLVANDTNDALDIFVRDRVAMTTERVSLSTTNQQASAWFNSDVRISSDGRYVLFAANGLDPADTSPNQDLYRRDRLTGTTLWVTGPAYLGTPWTFDMSRDGRVVVYSNSPSFAAESLTFRDLSTGQTWSLTGVAGSATVTGHGYDGGCVSGDGRFVFATHRVYDLQGGYRAHFERFELSTGTTTTVFTTDSSAMTYAADFAGRHLLYTDFGFGVLSGATLLFRFDTQTFESLRMDLRSLPPPMFGFQGMGVREGALSDDGAHVAFTSDDDTILPGDLNPWHNAFVRVAAQRGSLRLDFDALGVDTDGDSNGVSISGDGRTIAFDSSATTLVVNDTNLAYDIFVRTICGPHHPDADGDGYGAANSGSTPLCLPAPAGWSVSALDCDDADASIHPGQAEVCDGIDQNCNTFVDDDAAGAAYCTVSVQGTTCSPAMFATGCASASATSGFTLTAGDLDPQRSCAFFYGLGPALVPWGNRGLGWMCIAAPRQRTPVMNSGGSSLCSGTMSLDVWAWMSANPGVLATPFVPGQELFIQGWFRDPSSTANTSTTSAWSVTVGP